MQLYVHPQLHQSCPTLFAQSHPISCSIPLPIVSRDLFDLESFCYPKLAIHSRANKSTTLE